MLSGSVRRAGDKVRLSAELADCESGATMWSDRFAGEAADLFELQDELSARVVATITPQVQESELRRVLRKRPENLDAYECVLRGLDLYYSFNDPTFKQALLMFERAMALDSTYAMAHAMAAGCHGTRVLRGLSTDPVADQKETERLCRLALILDRFDPHALSISGHFSAYFFQDFDYAIELFDRALAANPSSAIAWLHSSPTFSYIGETREARRRADIGLRLSPYDAHVFISYATIALASYAAGDYGEAVRWARRSAALNPHFGGNRRLLAASLAAAGEIDEARQAGLELLRVDPKFSATRFAESYAFKDPAKRRLFGQHLVKAGLPE
jgi:adenylate cyclase